MLGSPSMKKTIALTAMVLVAGAAPAFAATAAQPPVPNGSKLVGEASVTEIRAFPEEVKTAAGPRGVEEAQGVAGTDRLYEAPEKYPAAVSFFDKTLAQDRFTVNARTVTRTSTYWSVKEPDGTIGRLAVRNTTPTTIEWVTARAASETSTPKH